MKYLFQIFCVGILACNNNSTTSPSTDSTGTAAPATIPTDTAAAIVTPACYAYETSNNQVLLQLTTLHPAVSGRLKYDFLGKDKNEGTISGTMSGDTLYANFRFTANGKKSVRQVAFLRKGTAFAEGTGETQQKGDTTLFSNTDTLSFNGALLKEVPCPNP